MKIRNEIQTLGTLVVIGCFTAAEAALHVLEAHPSWEFAWKINLEFFKPFNVARNVDSPILPMFGSSTLSINLVLLVLAVLVRALRFRFGVAAFANLSFGLSLTLAYVWFVGEQPHQTASLIAFGAKSSQSGLMVWLLLLVSFAACAVSHLTFMRDIRRPEVLPPLVPASRGDRGGISVRTGSTL